MVTRATINARRKCLTSTLPQRICPSLMIAALMITSLDAAQVLAGDTALQGHVYALDESGKFAGAIAGAKIELTDQAGTPVGPSATADGSGRYNTPVPRAGTFYYKLEAPGYKDEHHGRGFMVSKSGRTSTVDFWMVKGKDDPESEPAHVPAVKLGVLRGLVYEVTPQNERKAVSNARIRLRRDGRPELIEVSTEELPRQEPETRGDREAISRNYEINLPVGTYHASVDAVAFEQLVDAEPIRIEPPRPGEAIRAVTRDFQLTRARAESPKGQGLRVTVKLAGKQQEREIPVRLFSPRLPDPQEGLQPDYVRSTGEYRATINLPVGSHWVMAMAQGHLPKRSTPREVLAGEYTSVAITLNPVAESPDDEATQPSEPEETAPMVLAWTAKVQGRSADGATRPLDGAEVRLMQPGGDVSRAPRQTTENGGIAHFQVADPGNYVAVAVHRGYESAFSVVNISADGEKERQFTLIAKSRPSAPSVPASPPDGKSDPQTDPGEESPAARPESRAEQFLVRGYVKREKMLGPNGKSGYVGVDGATVTFVRLGKVKLSEKSQFADVSETRDGAGGAYSVSLPNGQYQCRVSLPSGYHLQPNERSRLARPMTIAANMRFDIEVDKTPQIEQTPSYDPPEEEEQPPQIERTPVAQRVRVRAYVVSDRSNPGHGGGVLRYSSASQNRYVAVKSAEVSWYLGSRYIGSAVTDDRGEAVVDGLPPGDSYTAVVAPSGNQRYMGFRRNGLRIQPEVLYQGRYELRRDNRPVFVVARVVEETAPTRPITRPSQSTTGWPGPHYPPNQTNRQPAPQVPQQAWLVVNPKQSIPKPRVGWQVVPLNEGMITVKEGGDRGPTAASGPVRNGSFTTSRVKAGGRYLIIVSNGRDRASKWVTLHAGTNVVNDLVLQRSDVATIPDRASSQGNRTEGIMTEVAPIVIPQQLIEQWVQPNKQLNRVQ